jgi:BioD-like phosphotransacetylase family protein
MKPTIIYITGFRQHAGKTTTCLGLLGLLKKKYSLDDIGYIKPVGQELVKLADGSMIDKDVRIIDQFIGLPDFDPKSASPVRLGSGFTKDYLNNPDKKTESLKLRDDILASFARLKNKKVIVAEGTGHPGVGAIVGLSNADVSNLIGAETVFLSGGGIGKALDMLEVDLSYFIYKKSRVRGLIFNKCIPEKLDQVKHYLNEDLINSVYGKRFKSRLSIFGYLPEVDILAKPSLLSVKEQFRSADVISAGDPKDWEKPINEIRVISMTLESISFDHYFHAGDLLLIGIASGDRLEKIIAWNNSLRERDGRGLGGIILTCADAACPQEQTQKAIADSGIPAFCINEDTAKAEHIVESCIENTKIQLYDQDKFEKVQAIFDQYFDLDKFLWSLRLKK